MCDYCFSSDVSSVAFAVISRLSSVLSGPFCTGFWSTQRVLFVGPLTVIGASCCCPILLALLRTPTTTIIITFKRLLCIRHIFITCSLASYNNFNVFALRALLGAHFRTVFSNFRAHAHLCVTFIADFNSDRLRALFHDEFFARLSVHMCTFFNTLIIASSGHSDAVVRLLIFNSISGTGPLTF